VRKYNFSVKSYFSWFFVYVFFQTPPYPLSALRSILLCFPLHIILTASETVTGMRNLCCYFIYSTCDNTDVAYRRPNSTSKRNISSTLLCKMTFCRSLKSYVLLISICSGVHLGKLLFWMYIYITKNYVNLNVRTNLKKI
jgi:hypothetical protein